MYFVSFYQIKLTLGKERQCQPLTTQIIPAHLAAVAAAAAAAIGNSFTHRTNHATSHTPTPGLFQTQTLPAALLRPAPGPVRTSHPQVLFAPYWHISPRRSSFTYNKKQIMCFINTRPRSHVNISFYASGILNIFTPWSYLLPVLMWIILHLKLKPTAAKHLVLCCDGFISLIPLKMWTIHAFCAILQPMAHTQTPYLDLHCTAIMYKTNPVNYAVSLFHDARHSLS